MSTKVYRSCDLCKKCTNTDEDTVYFGDWQKQGKITVHYFCLLLSTHLPQNGCDSAGILGFQMRDIRREIAAAAKRTCCFCGSRHASIACCKCKDYFHLVCGRKNRCLFQFCDEFRSFCPNCLPLDAHQLKAVKDPPSKNEGCYICHKAIGFYDPLDCIYGACCGRGYVHTLCMKRYALAAGYYLTCIWCKSASFRESVRLQGIFVPDRDAQWELQGGAFVDLHKGHRRCDMEPCLCPRGRDYFSATGRYQLILCSLCGSFGAHNPLCLPGMSKAKVPSAEFKCDTCSNTEHLVTLREQQVTGNDKEYAENINKSIYLLKRTTPFQEQHHNRSEETPYFSDCSESSLGSSTCTVVPMRTVDAAALPPPAPIAKADACASPKQSNKDEINVETQLLPLSLSSTQSEEDAQVLNHSGTSQCEEDEEQSPIITSTSEDPADAVGDTVTFDAFEFDGPLNVIGTCTVRIHMSDPRFAGKTLEEIQATCEFKEDDIIGHSSDRGMFEEIDRIIAQYPK